MHIFFFDSDLLENISKESACPNYTEAVRRLCSPGKPGDLEMPVFVETEHNFKINNFAAFEMDINKNCFYDFNIDRRWDVISNIKVVFISLETQAASTPNGTPRPNGTQRPNATQIPNGTPRPQLYVNRSCITPGTTTTTTTLPCLLPMLAMYSDMKLRVFMPNDARVSAFKVMFRGHLLDIKSRNQWMNRKDVMCDGLRYKDGVIINL